MLFGGDQIAMSRPGAMVALWLGVVALTVGTWLTALLPPSVIARQARARAGMIGGTAVLGLIAFLVGRLAQGLWMPLRQATFACATFVLALLSPTAVADPKTLELGAQQFVVEIAPQCSGYEGVGLTWAFVLAALWLFRARLRFPAALLLLVPATLLPFIANIGRLVALVLLGAYVSPELAEGGFHSYAGSILFCAVALGIVAFGLRTRFFARDRDAARAADDADDVTFGAVAAYLVPFLAMTGAGLVSHAFSGGDSEPLFALRPAVGLIALVLLHRHYRALVRAWTPSVIALLGGLGVAALWLAMDRLAGGARRHDGRGDEPRRGGPRAVGDPARADRRGARLPRLPRAPHLRRGLRARRRGGASVARHRHLLGRVRAPAPPATGRNCGRAGLRDHLPPARRARRRRRRARGHQRRAGAGRLVHRPLGSLDLTVADNGWRAVYCRP